VFNRYGQLINCVEGPKRQIFVPIVEPRPNELIKQGGDELSIVEMRNAIVQSNVGVENVTSMGLGACEGLLMLDSEGSDDRDIGMPNLIIVKPDDQLQITSGDEREGESGDCKRRLGTWERMRRRPES